MQTEAMRLLGMWQSMDDGTMVVSTKLLLLFLGVMGAAVLLQAIAMVTMAAGAAKARREMVRIAEEFRAKADPVLDLSRTILQDAAPKVRVIGDNLARASFVVREQAERVEGSVQNVMARVDHQVARTDHMITSMLNAVESVVDMLHQATLGPTRQIVGILSGLRAMVGRFIERRPAPPPRQDNEGLEL